MLRPYGVRSRMVGNLPSTALPFLAGRYMSVANITPSRRATRWLLWRTTSNGVAVSRARGNALVSKLSEPASAANWRRVSRRGIGSVCLTQPGLAFPAAQKRAKDSTQDLATDAGADGPRGTRGDGLDDAGGAFAPAWAGLAEQ